MYLCDFIDSCLLLSRVTSKVLNSLALGILHVGGCLGVLISDHL